MSLEKIALASNQSTHIHQDVMASRAIVTKPMHHSQVDPDQTHETVSHRAECAEQLRQARLRQLEEIQLDEGLDKDEQTVTRSDPALDIKPSDAKSVPLGPRRHKSPDPLGALEASLSQHASVPAPEASAHQSQVLPKKQSRKAFRIQGSDEPQASQDTRTSLNSSPLFVQHSHKYKERNRKDPHAERLRRIWKEVSDKHRGLRKMEKKGETNRTSLTQARRQKLSPKKKGSKKRDRAAESAPKEDPAPSKRPHHPKLNKKGQQPNQQDHPQSPDLHNNRQQRSPNAPSPSDKPSLHHPIHSPPPHSETTPPPAPTVMPSSTPPATIHIYQHHDPAPYPPPDPPPAPTANPSRYAASHCQGCNVNLAEIERTTRFRYPKACPLCHTPRTYLPPPQPQPTTPKLMLQQWEGIHNQAMAQPNLVSGAYIPSPNLSEDRNLYALVIQNKPACMQPEDRHSAMSNQNKRYSPADVHSEMDPHLEAKRAKVVEERNGYEGGGIMYLHCEEGGIEDEMYDDDVEDGILENESEADDEATVDEEEWEQESKGGWEGTYEEEEIAIRSEDEV